MFVNCVYGWACWRVGVVLWIIAWPWCSVSDKVMKNWLSCFLIRLRPPSLPHDPYKDIHAKSGMQEWCMTAACRHAHVRMHICALAHSNPVNPWLILFVWRTQSCSYTTKPKRMESCCGSKKLQENGGNVESRAEGEERKGGRQPEGEQSVPDKQWPVKI